MKKKIIANIIMVAVIAVILSAGILGVGYIRGWFDRVDETAAVLTDIRGVISMERGGVIYPVENDTVLRAEDKITAGSGATAVIRIGSDYITIGSGAALTVSDPSAGSFSAGVDAGEVFVNTVQPIELSFDTRQIRIADAVAAVSVRSGAQTVSVFRGSVEDAAAGQAIEYIGQETAVQAMQLGSLNDFTIGQIRAANESTTMCYSNADLDELDAKRQQALQDLINSMTPTQPSDTEPTGPSETESTQPTETEPTQPSETEPTGPSETEPVKPPVTEPTDPAQTDPTEPRETDPTEPSETEPTQPAQTDPTEPSETEPSQTEATEPPTSQLPAEEPAGSCYITIRCDTILNNMEDLTPGKAEFVPADGIILPVVEVPFYEGETVFDVLKRICEIADIQLEYSWTPLYDSYYIEGINHLYEFDCGYQSGWMYKVNEWFPNYGCSSYEVGDGDVIVWCYTCQGLGTDVGSSEWME